MWFDEAPHDLLRDQFKIPGILLQCVCGILSPALGDKSADDVKS